MHTASSEYVSWIINNIAKEVTSAYKGGRVMKFNILDGGGDGEHSAAGLWVYPKYMQCRTHSPMDWYHLAAYNDSIEVMHGPQIAGRRTCRCYDNSIGAA